MAPATTQKAQIIKVTPQMFLANTRPKRLRVNTANYTDGGQTKFQLPQAGFADKLLLSVAATIVVAGTVTSGTWASFANGVPAPFSMMKTIQFGSNNSLNLRYFNGWSCYKWVRWRYANDPRQTTPTSFSTNTLAALGLNQTTGNIVGGANVVAGTFVFNFNVPIDLAYNRQAVQGLLSLQANNIIYTLTMFWGQITGGIGATGGSNDMFSSLVGTGLTVTANVVCTVGLDTWDVPAFPANHDMSGLSNTYMSVTDTTASPLVAGQNKYLPPQNDVYTMIGLEVINAGAPVATANISSPQWSYGNNQFPFVEDYITLLTRDYYYHGIPSVDGNIFYDLGIRNAQPEKRDWNDGFDDSSITNLAIYFNLPGTLTISGVNQINVILENLNRFAN